MQGLSAQRSFLVLHAYILSFFFLMSLPDCRLGTTSTGTYGTYLLSLGGLPQPLSFAGTCEPGQPGLKVEPKPGKATLFYSLRPDGAPDPFSLHSGCAPHGVGRGSSPGGGKTKKMSEKWAVNKWVWSERYRSPPLSPTK